MGIRLILAPWWLRWLVLAVAMTAVAGPMWILFTPDDGSSWAARAVQAPVLGIGVATIMTFTQERSRRPYLAILDGLNPDQQRLALRASRHGDIPSDPSVLQAAVRLCDLLVGTRMRTPRWARWVGYALPAVGASLAATAWIFQHDIRRGAIYLAFSGFLTAAYWWDARTVRRLHQRLDILRTAAAASIGEVRPLAEADYPPAMPSRKAWLISCVAMVALCVAAGIGSYMLDKPGRQCDTAARIIIDIAGENDDFIHSKVILPDGPNISVFEEWSRRIHETASKVSRPDLAPHTQKIAELSDQAVTVVRQTRESPGTSADQDKQRLAYILLIKQMVDEHEPIHTICRKNRTE